MTASLIKTVCTLLEQQTRFVMATIISHTGSTPRISGTRMLITGDGAITGTIGGGLLEARVMKKAIEIIRDNAPSAFMPFDLSCDDVAGMDMICGGQAEIFLELIHPSDENTAIFNTWNHTLQQREKGFFLTTVVGDRQHVERVDHAIWHPDRDWPGTPPLSKAALQETRKAIEQTQALRALQIDNNLVLIEPALAPEKAFLCGAGHVAKPTAQLCVMTGFYVTVLDDRREFANSHHFPDVHEIQVLESFEQAFDSLKVDETSSIIIFTRGHLHDHIVLANALKTKAGYIGMIGSRRKRDNIYKALLHTGYRQADLDRVFSPIGLAIGAQSPEEIAVSIVAEMIQQRAQRSR